LKDAVEDEVADEEEVEAMLRFRGAGDAEVVTAAGGGTIDSEVPDRRAAATVLFDGSMGEGGTGAGIGAGGAVASAAAGRGDAEEEEEEGLPAAIREKVFNMAVAIACNMDFSSGLGARA